MIIDLSGKTALVTASSKGIGFAISKALLDAGANVCICSRNEDNLRAAEKELANAEQVFAMAGDIADPEFLKELVNQRSRAFRIDRHTRQQQRWSTRGRGPLVN